MVTSKYCDNGDGVIYWDGPPEEEQAWLLSQPPSYVLKRRELYASPQEQLDMQYWDSINGTTTWIDHVAAVKAKCPKSDQDVITK